MTTMTYEPSLLTPAEEQVLNYMLKAGHITAQRAQNDLGMSSGSMTRRITSLVGRGFVINRERKRHPINKRLFTKYSVDCEATGDLSAKKVSTEGENGTRFRVGEIWEAREGTQYIIVSTKRHSEHYQVSAETCEIGKPGLTDFFTDQGYFLASKIPTKYDLITKVYPRPTKQPSH